MKEAALVFGAGKTGRGFAAHLAYLGGYKIILIDKNRQLVNDLKKANQYDIQVLGNESMNCTVKIFAAHYIQENSWHEDFINTSLAFTSVFGNNFEELAQYLSPALDKRYKENPEQVLTIITCENLTNSAGLLKRMITKNLGGEKEKWLSEYICFSESIILRTCLDSDINQSQLTVRAQNFFELPCDGEAIKEIPGIYGLKLVKNFNNQLRRKIFTYNCINAVITYLGAKRGFSQLHEASNDPEIIEIAQKAADETSKAQVAEFGFDTKEQEEWTKAAFAKFADKNIPDPIERNGADPVRKLGREDRLIGPALLALKHNYYPEGLLDGIYACFEYYDKSKNLRITDLIHEKGLEFILHEVCGLSEDEELYKLLKEQFIIRNLNGEK